MVQPVPGAMKSGTVSLSAAPPAANAGIRDEPKSTPATANGFKDANVDIAGLSREIQTLFRRIQSPPVSKVNARSIDTAQARDLARPARLAPQPDAIELIVLFRRR